MLDENSVHYCYIPKINTQKQLYISNFRRTVKTYGLLQALDFAVLERVQNDVVLEPDYDFGELVVVLMVPWENENYGP